MAPETKHITQAFEAKFAESSTTPGLMTGYGAVYGNIDFAGDIIAHGAFAKSCSDYKSRKIKLPFLYQHDTNEPIGLITDMKEDSYGLLITVQLSLGIQKARDAYELMKDGVITGLSVGFYSIKDELNAAGVRTIREAKLMEVSAVTMPCNDRARIESVKNSPGSVNTYTLTSDEVKGVAAGLSALKGRLLDDVTETDVATIDAAITLLDRLGGQTKTIEGEPPIESFGQDSEALATGEAEAEALSENIEDVDSDFAKKFVSLIHELKHIL